MTKCRFMEAPIRILLVRHGETDWNRLQRFQGRSDVPLNETGLAQAEALGLALRAEPLCSFYSSPLKRALETARIIRKHHPMAPLLVDGDLVEMHLGAFDGMRASDWAASNREFLAHWSTHPATVRMPGGETLEEVQQRALEAMDRILARHRNGQSILVCTHNFVILSILCHAMGLPLDRFREVKQGTGSLSRLCYSEGILWIQKLDDRSHLPPPLEVTDSKVGETP